MAHRRFHNPDGVMGEARSHNSIQLPDGVTIDDASEDLYARVGERFPVRWDPWSTAEPVIDPDDLPSGVAEADVETALGNMKTDGVI